MHSLPRHHLEVSGQLHAPAALPPGKERPVPIGYRLGELDAVVKRKTSLILPGIEPRSSSQLSRLPYVTMLS
jgi:hypothetical protein